MPFPVYFLNDSPSPNVLWDVIIFITAITNYHKLSGLRKTNLLSYSSLGQNYDTGLDMVRSRCWEGFIFFWYLKGECFLTFSNFKRLPRFLGLWLFPPYLKPAMVSHLLLTSHHLTLLLSSHFSYCCEKSFFTFRVSCDYIGFIWVIQNNPFRSTVPHKHRSCPHLKSSCYSNEVRLQFCFSRVLASCPQIIILK